LCSLAYCKPVCFTIQKAVLQQFQSLARLGLAQSPQCFLCAKAHSNLIHRQPPPSPNRNPAYGLTFALASASGGKLECGPQNAYAALRRRSYSPAAKWYSSMYLYRIAMTAGVGGGCLGEIGEIGSIGRVVVYVCAYHGRADDGRTVPRVVHT
jgi:hypothetical protein